MCLIDLIGTCLLAFGFLKFILVIGSITRIGFVKSREERRLEIYRVVCLPCLMFVANSFLPLAKVVAIADERSPKSARLVEIGIEVVER